MNYRNLGTSGIRLSEIGLGCEGFTGKDETFAKELIDLAFSLGINCMDLYSSDPQTRSNIGAALSGRRDQFFLQAHLCTVWKNGQYQRTRSIDQVRSSFQDLLTRLRTDYVDIGMIHYVDSLEDWRAISSGPVMEYAMEMKEKGIIKAIGLSSHNPIAALEAVSSGQIQVLMFSVNPCYDLLPGDEDCEKLWDAKSYSRPLLNMDPQRTALYETCQRLDVGITVMKAFGGGDLLSSHSPAKVALTSSQCIHYALTRPGVTSVMCGVHTLEELKSCASYEQAPMDEKDFAAALSSFSQISWEGYCMYCGHCAPCPKGIPVADVTKFLTLAASQSTIPETVREHYATLPHTASECIMCGACESRCPFHVSIRENMHRASALFGR